MTDDALLTEQLDYYRARAGEYDQWWFREGRFDRGAEANAEWFAETAELERVLERFGPRGDVLELACGTGLWTRHLTGFSDAVTAVDGAPEVLAINHARVGDGRVTHVEADLFAWRPEPSAYDVCFFSFWLSHVPPERFSDFWGNVASGLRPASRRPGAVHRQREDRALDGRRSSPPRRRAAHHDPAPRRREGI